MITTIIIFILGSALFLIIVVFYALKPDIWKKIMLNDSITGQVSIFDTGLVKQGDMGKTVSRIAPSGKAFFNNKYFEVHAIDDFIDENINIVVIKIQSNKIYVKPGGSETKTSEIAIK